MPCFWKAALISAVTMLGVPLRLPPTGTYAAQAGLNAFMVRDLLGHKTMAMTGPCRAGLPLP